MIRGKIIREFFKRKALPAMYTVEAAGVMSAVLFVIMILIHQAFLLNGEITGNFGLHLQVETERHLIDNRKKWNIKKEASGNGWDLEITAPVFRPENFLRMWSLTEGLS